VGKKEGFITGDREVVRRAEAFGDRVRFTGVLEEGQLRQFYAFADLLVFPSLYEGFGLPPLEAMAIGTPVASSSSASLPEVCGDAALYFDPRNVEEMADRIKEILKNPDLRKNLVKKGFDQAKKFSWDHSAAEVCEVIGTMA
jgi:glycosyltransferase involved in cell wall biosynthesis